MDLYKKNKKTYSLTVFIFIVTSVFVTGFAYFAEVQKQKVTTSRLELERARMLVQRILYLREKKSDLQEIKTLNAGLWELGEAIKKKESTLWLIDFSLSEYYNKSDVKMGDHLVHFSKTIKNDIKLREKNLSEVNEVEEKVIESSDSAILAMNPLIDGLGSEYRRLNKLIAAAYITLFIVFSLPLIFISFQIFAPLQLEHFSARREKENYERLMKVIESKGNHYTWKLDLTTRTIERSQMMLVLLGIENQDSNYKKLKDEYSFIEEEDRIIFEKALLKTENVGATFLAEVMVKAISGKEYWLKYEGEKVFEGEREIILGTVSNITNIKNAQERFLSLFDFTDQPSIIFSETEIVKANFAAQKYLDYENTQFLFSIHPAILSPIYQENGESTIEKIKNAIRTAKLEGKSVFNWTFLKSTGETFNAKVKIFPLVFGNKDLTMMIVQDNYIVENLQRRLVHTERKYLFEKRRRVEFVSQISFKLQKDLIDIFKHIKDKADQQFLNDFSFKARSLWKSVVFREIEDEPNVVVFDLKQTLEVMVETWEHFASAKKLKFIPNFDGLSKGGELVWGDAQKIQAIFSILIEKMVAFTNEGECIRISIEKVKNVGRKRDYRISFVAKGELLSKEDISDNLKYESDNKGYVRDLKPLKKAIYYVELLQGNLFVKSNHELGNKFQLDLFLEKAFIEESENKENFSMVDSSYDDRVKNIKGNFSYTKFYRHLGGDWDTIQLVAYDFLDYYPKALANIQIAINDRNAKSLENEATSLYGALVYFPYYEILERVIILQKMGKLANFDAAEKNLNLLNSELGQLAQGLESFLSEEKVA
jgi:hypothetical protein